MLELYTKRNFRCDCGTKRMPNVRCNLDALKFEENTENLYNQNFSGLYCICHRPYPDPEEEIEDEMIQCIVCEDWYHGRHLSSETPSGDDFSEMICGTCTEKCDFLKYYQKLQVDIKKNSPEKITKGDETTEVDIESSPNTSVADTSIDETKITENGKHKLTEPDDSEPPAKKEKLDDDACIRPNIVPKENKGATFWCHDWRKKLCKCSTCIDIYKKAKVEFIIDLEDTCHFYEEIGKNKPNQETQYDKGIQALSNMNHTNQIEMIQGYNLLKNRLKDFLQDFVTNQQVVTEDDVRRFFTQLNEEKKNDNVIVPRTCR